MFRFSFSKLFRRMSSRSAADRRRAGVQPRLVVEALEQRCLPSFSAPIAVPSTFNQAMAVGDFTGDGIADLATIRGNTLTVLQATATAPFKALSRRLDSLMALTH